MHQNRFCPGLSPRPRYRGAYSAPRTLTGFQGPTSKGKEGRGDDIGGEDREERKVMERKGRIEVGGQLLRLSLIHI